MNFEPPEGATSLDPDELEGLKFKHVTTRGELDQLEQANIQSGLQWSAKSRHENILTEVFVRKLHKKLFGDVWLWAGDFRTTGKNIGVDPREIGEQLRLLLDDLSFWIEQGTYAPKEAAIMFHHRLVFIHLFPNGNGRHGRIMTDIILKKLMDESPIDWFADHDLQAMDQRRAEYLNALRAADCGTFDLLLRFAGIQTPIGGHDE